MTIHQGNFECFMEIYAEKLKEARVKYPHDYCWPDSQFDAVIERMKAGVARGHFNKDSHAFKATCKELKIKHTYKAIQEFISL